MRLASKAAAFSIAALLVFFGTAPLSVFAEGLAETDTAEPSLEMSVQADPEGDEASGGALANSFRYEDGVLVGSDTEFSTDDPGISLLSLDARSMPNTWQKQGNDYVVVSGLNQGMRVSNAKGFGIDVSHHQGVIDWARVKSSGLVDYVIIRCGWGSDYTSQDDTQFINNVRGCQQNGIPFGIYLYSYAYNTSMAQSEANHVLRLLSAAGLSPSQVAYPVYYDLENEAKTGRPAGEEGGAVVPISNATLEAMAQTFCSTIESAGYAPGVYANRNWWNNYLTGSSFTQWSKWVAEYDYSCSYTGQYDMWQCMSDGTLPGIGTNVDINFDYVDLEQLGAGQTAWSRVYGQDQLDTMQQISKTGWSSSKTVVIATDNTYWDALTASALAGAYDCPILLTHGNTLSPQAQAEIRRLGATTAYVCGGPIAIASNVDNQIKAAGCSNVVRVYGQDQQGTARAIADRVQQNASSKTCIIATSWTFQDSLSVSPYAYAGETPIYLCDSGSNRLSSATLESIRKGGGYSKAIIVGGPIAVDSGVESQLKSAGVTSSQRLYGQTEYETSLAIAKWEISQGMTANNMAVATGTTFYDALSGSALCGENNAVLVIASDSNRVCLTDLVAGQASNISKGYVFGGPIAVSRATWNVLMRAYLY